MTVQKIWFVQVKRTLLENPLYPEDASAIFAILLWALSNPDDQEVQQELFEPKDWNRLLDLDIITEQGYLNRAFFSNSKHDRNFLQPGAVIVRRRG